MSNHCRYVSYVRYSSSSNSKDCKRENWLLQFDGGSRGNPGTAGAGAVLYTLHGDGDENNVIKKTEKWAGYFYIGNTTNNVAEYMGLIEGLKQAIVLDIKYIEIEGDSQLVISQLNGIYRVKHSNLIPLYKG
jgi:ribonuclease HI